MKWITNLRLKETDATEVYGEPCPVNGFVFDRPKRGNGWGLRQLEKLGHVGLYDPNQEEEQEQ
jgi:hypothetical protein